MINIIKNFLANFSFVYKFALNLKTYFSNNRIFYLIPVNELQNFELQIDNFHKFSKKNINKILKKNQEFYLYITSKRISKKIILTNFKELFNLLKKNNSDIVYNGNCRFNSEIINLSTLKIYSTMFDVENYPHRFFDFHQQKNISLANVGIEHRNYHFNGSFDLPGGGRSIGDGGDVNFRLKFIPDLTNKTFLDIGSEEGYSVFNALTKNAKFAKGLNINESEEYDYFPEYKRPKNITARSRQNIEKTTNFLKKLYNLNNSSRISFEYKNIYNLNNEKYDFVFCFGVLYHLKNPYLAIENLYKATNETLLIETQGSIQNKNLKYSAAIGEDGFVRHSPESLKFLLLQAGFNTVEILFSGVNKQKKISNIVLKALKH